MNPVEELGSDVENFNRNVLILENKIKLLNTNSDTKDNRRQILQLVSDTTMLARKTETTCRKVNPADLITGERVRYNRLMKTFKHYMTRFQSLQQEAFDRTSTAGSPAHTSPIQEAIREEPRPPSLTPQDITEKIKQLETQLKLAKAELHAIRRSKIPVANEVTKLIPYTSAQMLADNDLREREQVLVQLEHEISNMKEVFATFVTVVNEQGETIENIEEIVERAEAAIMRNKQLGQYKNCNRQLKICIAVIVILVILTILIVILIILGVTGVFNRK